MRLGVKILLAGLFAVCVYRAATQSLVHDEALTFRLYIAGPIEAIFQSYDPNHHFLNTLLMRASASIFGDSELALRLPALAGAALYFVSIYRLSLAAFGETALFPLAVALMSLNPFTLDFMVAARGYGMALALMMFALAMVYESLAVESLPRKNLVLAGAALGLSVAANLVFLLPVLGVAGITLYLLPRLEPSPVKAAGKHSKRKRPALRKAWPLWVWFVTPMAVVGLLYFETAPIEQMKLALFYVGAHSIVESMRNMALVALQHSGPLRHGLVADRWRDAVAFVVAPGIVVAAFAAGWRTKDHVLLLASVPLVFASAAVVLMHYVLDRPYPADRTGIYFAPLVCLALVGLARLHKTGAKAVYALSAILLVQFVLAFNTRMFSVWDYDADTRDMSRYIAAHRSAGAGTVRVGGSWELSEAMAYYMVKNNWQWMAVERRPPELGYDYYMLVPHDMGLLSQMGLKAVYRGPVSGSILAVPSR
jgi:hypothetical protein